MKPNLFLITIPEEQLAVLNEGPPHILAAAGRHFPSSYSADHCSLFHIAHTSQTSWPCPAESSRTVSHQIHLAR